MKQALPAATIEYDGSQMANNQNPHDNIELRYVIKGINE